MKYLFLLLLLFSLTSHAEPSNREIDSLVTKLSACPGWRNGIYPSINIARDAPIDKVIDEALKMNVFPPGQHIEKYYIITEKDVSIPKPELSITASTTGPNFNPPPFLSERPIYNTNFVTQLTLQSLLQWNPKTIVYYFQRPTSYIAVLAETNIGRKIILLKCEQMFWWSRVFDAKCST